MASGSFEDFGRGVFGHTISINVVLQRVTFWRQAWPVAPAVGASGSFEGFGRGVVGHTMSFLTPFTARHILESCVASGSFEGFGRNVFGHTVSISAVLQRGTF